MNVRGLGMVVGLMVLSLTAEGQTTRILMVGDSWADAMWSLRSVQGALDDVGLGQFEELGDTTAIGGTLASQWAQPSGGSVNLQLLTDALATNPDIDIVHLSIGGNDMLFAGFPNIADPETLFAGINDDIEIIVDHILAQRDDIRVLLVEYDYLRDNSPSANALQLQFAAGRMALAFEKERLYYFNGMGLMQATFGDPPAYDAEDVPYPGAYPTYDPFPGGDPDLGSPAHTFSDAIHLDGEGYDALAAACVEGFYSAWLTDTPLAETTVPSVFMEGGTLSLTIPGAIDFGLPVQWYRDGMPLSNAGPVDGADERTLTISPVAVADSGDYTATYDNYAKASATYGPVTIEVFAAEAPEGLPVGFGALAFGALALAMGGGSALLRRRVR